MADPTATLELGTDAEPAFTSETHWIEIARLALLSRAIDNLEEETGVVNYQFSAKGHELAQVLLSQKLNFPYDAASVYYRSRPFALGSGLTPVEAFQAGLARAVLHEGLFFFLIMKSCRSYHR